MVCFESCISLAYYPYVIDTIGYLYLRVTLLFLKNPSFFSRYVDRKNLGELVMENVFRFRLEFNSTLPRPLSSESYLHIEYIMLICGGGRH